MRRTNYLVIENNEQQIVLQDLGPWSEFLTITNGAEQVIEELAQAGLLVNGKRCLYYSSDEELSELIHENGKFVSFA